VTSGYGHVVRAFIATGIVTGFALAAAAQQLTSEQISAIRASCRSDFMANCAGVQPGTREALECLKHNAAKVSPACKTALDAVGPRPDESAAPAVHAPAKAAPAPAAETPPAAAEAPPPASAGGEPSAAAGEPAATPPGPATGEGKRHAAPQVASPQVASPHVASPNVAAIRAACRSDFGVHCPGVKPGGSAALHCLRANAAALSPPCRETVMAMGEGGAPSPEAPGAAPPPVAPLGPISPMRPRRALAILSLCAAERNTLCGNVPPGGGRILECLAENYARLSPECYGALARATR
jgi:hypothetical protein